MARRVSDVKRADTALRILEYHCVTCPTVEYVKLGPYKYVGLPVEAVQIVRCDCCTKLGVSLPPLVAEAKVAIAKPRAS